MAADIKYLVSVDAKKGTATIKKLDKDVGHMAETTAKTGSGFKGMWLQIGAGIAVAQGVMRSIKGLVDWMKKAVELSGIQEKAESDLRAALESTGREVEFNSKHFQEYASSLQQATIYGDEQIISAQALMIQLTKLNQEGIDMATKGAIGLASVYKTDLQAATTLVGKALAGNYGALSRYGIMVSRTATDEEKRLSILEQLQTMYKRAEAETGTFQGGLAQLSNTYGDLKEQVGDAVTRSEDFRKTITMINKAVRDAIDSGIITEWADMFIQGLKLMAQYSGILDSLKYIALYLAVKAEKTKQATEEGEKYNDMLDKQRKLLLEMQEINRQGVKITPIINEQTTAMWDQLMALEAMETTQLVFMETLPKTAQTAWEALSKISPATKEAAKEGEKFIDRLAGASTGLVSLGKEGSIASAIINTYQGASKTIAELGFPWAIPFVAMAIAAGMKQVAAIKKQAIPSAAVGGYLTGDTLVQAHRGEIIAPQPMLRETFREVIREGGGPTFNINIAEQLDPYSADRILKNQIIPGIIDALKSPHIRGQFQRGLGDR